MKFSLLISIYHKENSLYFDEAMLSIQNQTIQPNQIVLVEDGILTDSLYLIIDKYKNIFKDKLTIVKLPKNKGLGTALNIGMQECIYNLIARMDTDDIALPNRFEKQIEIFKNSDIDICSSWISEFVDTPHNIISYRKLPSSHSDIIKFAKKRSPINHPAVMYKKEAVQKAGEYKKMLGFEDYYLWVRMILAGSKFYNIEEPLVNMRINNQIQRRRGFKYALNEIKLYKEFLNLGFLNFFEFLQNICIRLTIRILPTKIVKIFYNYLRASK
ncbi:MAG: Glycosyl transferase family 2 [uncultured Campylobacterales bacterium]|uniref:Glycosyl transferase family 2 n=1 Tax=uncultured Campylobacterales bacterium TaxID=352960 RepID=A0A6S6SMM9_9BACT|nr:MAG: Glycosyl transferase family 2 [uncultured Campylobacterales bacterium]